MASLKYYLLCLLILHGLSGMPETIEKIYEIGGWSSNSTGLFQTVSVKGAVLSALPGEPLLPWLKVVLVMPPGQKAKSIEVIREGGQPIPGRWLLMPRQRVIPLSSVPDSGFLMNNALYRQNIPYPAAAHGILSTEYINGFSVALCTFTPLSYLPLTGQLTLFGRVTVRIETGPMEPGDKPVAPRVISPQMKQRVWTMIQNRESMTAYPDPDVSPETYHYLVIAPAIFGNEFQPLVDLNAKKGLSTRIVTIDSIVATTPGYDIQEKIRNFIIAQYQNHSIEYVLLAGDHALVKSRGLYCKVLSGNSVYEDYSIPSDLYYSALDGNFDANGNHIYGELNDNADLLPDLSVGRFPVGDVTALRNLIRKTVSYQTNPVLGELNRPLMVGEYLYNDPFTLGGPFMDLLIDNHNDNGYFTRGIPSVVNLISKLYDTLITPPNNVWNWSKAMLLASINRGSSFIHHLGHASTTYMLRMGMGDITNSNFALVNGIDHNFTLLYTQGCYCGAFDATGGCIGAKSVSIENFLVGGVFNSRYGWFNQGTTDGPSEHLQREFVSALYDSAAPEHHLGTAHLISKIETAPWVGLPGEFEPGAQRWCHFCCNLFGDPALEIWTSEPVSFTTLTWTGVVDKDWNNPQNWYPAQIPTSLSDVLIPSTVNTPEITTTSPATCHDLVIDPGSTLTNPTGKSMIIRGTLTLKKNDK